MEPASLTSALEALIPGALGIAIIALALRLAYKEGARRERKKIEFEQGRKEYEQRHKAEG